MYGYGSGLGLENGAAHADDIPDIHPFERFVFFFADIVACHVALDKAFYILDMAE